MSDINVYTFLDTLVLILKCVILITIILLAIINNSLVIISVVLYRKLRHVNNYFLVSLAFADLFVAMFAMTFNATLEILGKIVQLQLLKHVLLTLFSVETFKNLTCNLQFKSFKSYLSSSKLKSRSNSGLLLIFCSENFDINAISF